MKCKITTVIQARMGSHRLPGKVLLDLAGAPMLQRLIERASRSKLSDMLVVATSVEPSNDKVEELCADLNISIVRGDEEDVQSRFLVAAERTDADILVRLTGDNPFVDGALIDFLIDKFLLSDPLVDYASNIEGTAFPYGLYAEVFSVASLRASAVNATSEEREHVTRRLRNGTDFNRLIVEAPGAFGYDRLTVDTEEEYKYVSKLFKRYFDYDPRFEYSVLMDEHSFTSKEFAVREL
jgi:spore coat polysaccharide biosynthesis protein SpsF (cytidylyltransferase family)